MKQAELSHILSFFDGWFVSNITENISAAYARVSEANGKLKTAKGSDTCTVRVELVKDSKLIAATNYDSTVLDIGDLKYTSGELRLNRYDVTDKYVNVDVLTLNFERLNFNAIEPG